MLEALVGGGGGACGGWAACSCCWAGLPSARTAPEMLVMMRGGAWLPLLQLPGGARKVIRSWVKMIPARADRGQPAEDGAEFKYCVIAVVVAACHATGSVCTGWLMTVRL